MEIFKIGHGPWEKLFDGNVEKSPMTIHFNPESTLMVLIFEQEHSKTLGVVMELFKAFTVEGEIENFIETLPREIILLLKHDKRQTIKFLLLGSEPSYVEWVEEKFVEEIGELLKKIETSSVIINDLAKAYDIKLQEISSASEKIKKTFFSEPLLVPTLGSGFSQAQPKTQQISRGEFFVGLTKERHSIVEPVELFLKTLVAGGKTAERIHFLHVLVESFLLSNRSAIIFGSQNKFKGINSPSTEIEEIKKYKVGSDPVGFPLKMLKPVENIKVDLNYVSASAFSQIFGFDKTPSMQIILTTLAKNKVSGINDLIEKIRLTPLTENANAYQVRRTIRILKLVSLSFPTLFEGENDAEEIIVGGLKALGRATVIELSEIQPKIVFLVVYSLLNSVLAHCKQKENSSAARPVVVLPELTTLLPKGVGNGTEKEIQEVLKDLQKVGVGIALSVEKEIDTPKEILQFIEAKVNIVFGNDVGVSLKGRRSYRVFLRPALSACTEK